MRDENVFGVQICAGFPMRISTTSSKKNGSLEQAFHVIVCVFIYDCRSKLSVSSFMTADLCLHLLNITSDDFSEQTQNPENVLNPFEKMYSEGDVVSTWRWSEYCI